jgi:uncharacterized membrane protein
MQFADDVLIRVIVFVLGLCGFMIAKHIRNHKTKNTPLICPIGFDCHTVVHSDYSRFFNIPVEVLGMTYYAFLSFFYLILIFIPEVMPIALYGFLLLASFVAFLFSIYLIIIQIFVLKKGCSWCILSSVISALIFILTVFHYNFDFFAQILLHYK